MHETNCLNCGNDLSPQQNFCDNCGQSTHVHRITFFHLLHELIHFFTHADKGIFYLVKMLLKKPGIVIREYIRGKRRKYFNPLNFFFIVIGLFVFAIVTFKTNQPVNLSVAKEQVRKIPDIERRERRLEKLERLERGYTFTSKYSNFINFALSPIIAFIFFLFYKNSHYNYSEHLVANLYIMGMNGLFYIIVNVPLTFFLKGTSFSMLGLILFFIWEACYRGYTYYQFINKKGFLRFLYPFLISTLIVIVWVYSSSSLFKYYVEYGFPSFKALLT